ncbi:hypothetical protein [Winogradskyella luteola]|uniref:Uncharacterized protein n=1 Tax=Winogradskyella luteola TaxID=2828330 RepID=A0A9X1F5U7_9FLAO|nr:hypothetical protein [Winogradskyella luteola]MBV7267634.1 hypothetical protein [Winogradskyella luteola]
MNTKKIIECERTKIEKWSQFQLSNRWKTIGTVLCLVTFLTMIGLKFTEAEPLWLKDILRKVLLVGLLIIILSKEKMEDEMIVSLRAKSFTLAFIIGVLYALIQPVVDYVIHNFLYEASENNGFSYFQVLSFMLLIQMMFFEVLKRNR